MFRFEKEQQIFEIGGVRLGGQPGQLPTVMIGSIFYYGDKTTTDPVKGEFDKEKALKLLKDEEEQSLKTGNPRMLDVNGLNGRALAKFIDFIAENTSSPILMGGATAEAKITAARYVSEVGIAERCVYNSIGSDTTEEELRTIQETRIKSAVLLLFNKRWPTAEGRLEILGGKPPQKGLLKIAEESGLRNFLVDVSVVDMPDPGPAAKAVYFVKERFGLPAGCGPHNAVQMWRRGGHLDVSQVDSANAVAHVAPIMMGANFLLYGPLSRAPRIYLPCALADAYVAYAMRQQYRINPLTKEHPLFKIF
jgi:tetrahydromethanopterin S-methyltransferase subunit H